MHSACILTGPVAVNTYVAPNNTLTLASGAITNIGTMQFNAAANNTILGLNSNTTLTGGGTLTLSTSGGGAAIIQQESGGLTLTNTNNTIQGAGTIGNGGLALLNSSGGTINANVSGQTLFLNGSGGVTNNGLLEATNGGTLEILGSTVANTGGNITANGGAVVLNNATINGGTLQTVANGVATLNGVTISAGSTYTTGNDTNLFVSGTITNNGAIQVNAAANNTILGLNSNTTLTGGGTLTLSTSGGGAAIIQQESVGLTLTNTNNTIQGAGTIGNGSLTLVKSVGGTINANVSGQTLFVNGSGALTNNGTMQVDARAVLHVSGGALTNFSSGTLTGGTYLVAGTLKMDRLGSTGGEILTNAAKIVLDGATSAFLDSLNKDVFSNLSDNLAAGSFTSENGRNFTGSNNTTFDNAGFLDVGAGSIFLDDGEREL
jgi:hypothetical protein